MNKVIAITLSLTITCLFSTLSLYGQKISTPFEFQFEQKTLRGLIEKPQNQSSNALVIIVPGYGRTDFIEGNWFATLREKLVASGLTVCLWDKMGCGKSDGEFDAQQPVRNSANEAIAAIQELKRLKVSGSEKIGLWGLSRGGWICPLINEQYPIDFWISVSGTDDKENYGYLVKSNLIIAGKPPEEAERLSKAWMQGHKLFCAHDNYDNFLHAIQPLRADSTSRRLFGYTNKPTITEQDRKEYAQLQELYTSTGYFDTHSGLWVYLENFAGILEKLKCPVLALFGANDSQVDWRKTKKLYEKTIGNNSSSSLTIKVFEDCNHSLQRCVTCAYQEDLSASKWQACDKYYETMTAWLKSNKIIK